MKHRTSAAGAIALGALLVTSIVQAQGPLPAFAAKVEQVEDLPTGAGRDETFGMCTACHGFKLVSAQGMTREKWDETLTWMTDRHNMPHLEGEDRAVILDYLAAHYPPKAPSRTGGFKNPFAPP